MLTLASPSPLSASLPGRRETRARAGERGVTLVELLITMAIIVVVMGMAGLSAGVANSARLKRAASTVAGAIRVAYGHSNAVSKPVRLVLDFEQRMLTLEEATSSMRILKNDKTGGAAAATEAEKKAIEEAEQILKGPRPSRPTFQKTNAYGFNPDQGKPGKELEKNIRFLQVETGHEDLPVRTGRAYLYFWPGGQAERAVVQLSILGSDVDQDILSLVVSPLTGKTAIRRGKAMMMRPRDDAEGSERTDPGL